MSGTSPREQAFDDVAYTHLILSKPYRTPFTLLLTFVGHKPIRSMLSVPLRAARKRFREAVDIPTIGYLQHIHLGRYVGDPAIGRMAQRLHLARRR